MVTRIYLIMDEATMDDEFIKTCRIACRLLHNNRDIFFDQIIFSSFDQIPKEEKDTNYLFIIPNNIEVVPSIVFVPMIRNNFKRAFISFIIPFNDKECIQKLMKFDIDTVFIKPTRSYMVKKSIEIIIYNLLYKKVTDIERLKEVEESKMLVDVKSNTNKISTRIIKRDINTILLKMYFGKNFMGYKFSQYAILKCIELINDKKPVYITKTIYPYVAKKFNTNTQIVEHNIRTYIEKIFLNPNEFVMNNFVIPFKFKNSRPSNGEFINIIANGFIEGWIYNLINEDDIFNNVI